MPELGRQFATTTVVERPLRTLFVNPQPQAQFVELNLQPYPEWVSDILPPQNVDLFSRNVADGEPLPRLGGIDAIFGGGSFYSVYQNKPFMQETSDFFGAAEDAGISMLLVCFSDQLYGERKGGRVQKLNERQVGLETLDLGPVGSKDPVFQGLPVNPVLLTSHSDGLTVTPQSAPELPVVELGKGRRYPLKALRYGENIYGLQDHPEMKVKHLITLATFRRAQLEQEGIVGTSPGAFDAFIANIEKRGEAAERNGRSIGHNWINRVVGPNRNLRK